MYTVRGPAAWFHLVRVESPKLQFFFKQRAADVGGIMKFSGSCENEKRNKCIRNSLMEDENEGLECAHSNLHKKSLENRFNLLALKVNSKKGTSSFLLVLSGRKLISFKAIWVFFCNKIWFFPTCN